MERDPAPEATGGYRLSLDERACVALRRHLRPAHYQALLASSAGWRTYRRFHVTDHRLRLLFAEPRDRATENLLIGRIPLRLLLVHGIEGRGAVRRGVHRARGALKASFVTLGATKASNVTLGATKASFVALVGHLINLS